MINKFLIFGGLAAAIAVSVAVYWHVEAGNRSGDVDAASEKVAERERIYGECESVGGSNCPSQVSEAILDSWPVYGRHREAIENRNIGLGVAAASFGAGWVLSLIAGGLSRARKAGLHTKAGNAVGESLAASVQHTANAVQHTSNAMDRAKGRTRECPFCVEWIKPNATVCPHCRSEISSG